MSTKKTDNTFSFDDKNIAIGTSEFITEANPKLMYVVISVVFILFIIGILSSAYFKVADVVKVEGILVSSTPVYVSSAKAPITIGKIFKTNGAFINKGDIILNGDRYINLTQFKTIISDLNDKLLKIVNDSNCNFECLNNYREEILNKLKISSDENISFHLRKLGEKLLALNPVKRISIINTIRNFEQDIDFKNNLQVYKADRSGNIRYSSKFTPGAFFKVGAKLFEIIPNDNNLFLKSYIADKDVTKIKNDMNVFIEIKAFPAREYGVAKGKVELVSVSKSLDEGWENFYEVRIALGEQFLKKDEKRKDLKIGMIANSNIVIGRVSFIKKYFRKIIGE